MEPTPSESCEDDEQLPEKQGEGLINASSSDSGSQDAGAAVKVSKLMMRDLRMNHQTD